MMNDDDVARASGREAVEDLCRSGALDAFFERLDAGEFTWALSASVLVVPHMLIGPVRKLLTVCLCGCCPGRLV